MGEDFLLTWVGLEQGREPDFDAARAKIDALTPNELDKAADAGYWCEDFIVGDMAAAMKAEVDRLEKVWIGGSRDIARVEIRGADVLFTGGLSWGDGPTDAYGVIEHLIEIPGVLEAAGFTE